MGLDIVIIAVLVILGIVLLMAEIFLLPGFTIAGIAGGISLVGAIAYAFIYVGDTAGWITILVSIVASVGFFIYLVKSKAMDRIGLKTEIDSTVDQTDIKTVSVGDRGITESRLNPIGKANFNGVIIEAKSIDGEYIDEDVNVIAVKIENNVQVRIAKENE